MIKEQISTPTRIIYSPNLNSFNNNLISSHNTFHLNSFNNPFLISNENFLSNHKRYRDESYLNFSPNLTAMPFKTLTPIYNNFSPNLSHIFMFNNSQTGTPLDKKQGTAQKKTEDTFNYEANNQNSNKDNNTGNNNINNINNVNIEIPNLVLVSTPLNNPNMGFYTWVINGSSNQNITNTSKKINKLKKFKKSKHFEESVDN
jgi:hypothetical protein